MKKIEKFVCSITGQEFDTEAAAVKHENMAKEISETFSFWTEPEEKSCDFANGEYIIQRDQAFWEKMQDNVDAMVRKYEPWIIKNCEKDGEPWKKEFVRGYYVMRCLDDGGSLLYVWALRLLEICHICYRQYGQLYHANHCRHNKSERDINAEKAV